MTRYVLFELPRPLSVEYDAARVVRRSSFPYVLQDKFVVLPGRALLSNARHVGHHLNRFPANHVQGFTPRTPVIRRTGDVAPRSMTRNWVGRQLCERRL